MASRRSRHGTHLPRSNPTPNHPNFALTLSDPNHPNFNPNRNSLTPTLTLTRHDLPLYPTGGAAGGGLVNFVCEIPAGVTAKLEVRMLTPTPTPTPTPTLTLTLCMCICMISLGWRCRRGCRTTPPLPLALAHPPLRTTPQVNKKLPHNPIMQDTKKGAPPL